MDKLMRHLTAEPASQDTSYESSRTPQKLELRRELASAQKDRVKREYGYDLLDEVNELLVQTASDCDDHEEEAVELRKKSRLTGPSQKNDVVAISREKLAKACKLAWTYQVAGSKTDEDSASLYIPGYGYLFKPLGVRFDEVTADSLSLATRRDELPPMHGEIYTSMRPENALCILSAAHSDCALVSITKDGLLPLCQDALRLHGRVRRVDEQNISLRACRTSHKGTVAWLVKNRGVICCDSSVESALAALVMTARACSFQARTLAAVGGDLSRLDIPTESEIIRSRASLEERLSSQDVARTLFDGSVL
jgi:ribulose-5-phosphate 4-epimerase/fuculose-1-phosphate aldolase